jgi:hypothetical protein
MKGDQMTTITLYTAERQLILLRAPVIASGDRERVRLEVHTDESWIGYRLTAILFRDGERENACELPLDSAGKCALPPALLAEPCTLQIGLRGLIDDPDTDADAACRTTSLVRLRVAEGTPAEAGETLVNPTDATADENAVLAGETFYAGGGKAARTGNIPTYEEGTPTILTPYTETDPTVPAWAKKPNPPTAAEIGAAPAGYGLGTTSPKEITGISALDSATNNGWYYATGIGSTLGGVYVNHALFFVSSKDAYHVKQTIFPVDSNTIIFRSNDASGWGAYECLNPPMVLGVEYRTTERYMGKPVYVMAMDLGVLPTSDDKDVYYPVSLKCENIVSYDVIISNPDRGTRTLPTFASDGSAMAYAWSLTAAIRITVLRDMSVYNGRAVIKYVKD